MGSIVVSGLGKAFKQYDNRWQRLAEWIVPGGRVRHELKWVLRGIDFRLEPGEAVGIIGLNGAGKSTLLKMISGTMLPTEGAVEINGRVAALLELGLGFHPDFTGRQNVMMAGQLMGYHTADLLAQMQAIEAFAELDGYLDQPVRVYSSGMQMRLAFSVATCVRPDVLVVDEALSVGDAYFQQKSFERIREFQRLGTTLLLVSHDKQAIQSICSRAILLGRGTVLMEGEPEAVMDYYNAMLAQHQEQKVKQTRLDSGQLQTESGTGEAQVCEVGMFGADGVERNVFYIGQTLVIKVQVAINQAIDSLVLGYGIKDRLGQVMFGTNTFHTGQTLSDLKVGERYLYSIAFPVVLGVGSYSVNVALVRNASHVENNYHWVERAVMFEVLNKDKPYFQGSQWQDAVFEVCRIHVQR
jgi:lipopolysaccharide transport system ATP-binding protein